jgi:hypothetical protein
VERCSEEVAHASVPDLVTLLAALPSVTSELADGTTEADRVCGLSGACVDRIGAGVADLDLPALTDLMEAVSSTSGAGGNASGAAPGLGGGMAAALMQGSSSTKTGGVDGGGSGRVPHAFVGAVLEASGPKMGAADLPTVTRLASTVAQVCVCVCVGVCVWGRTI